MRATYRRRFDEMPSGTAVLVDIGADRRLRDCDPKRCAWSPDHGAEGNASRAKASHRSGVIRVIWGSSGQPNVEPIDRNVRLSV